MQQKNLTPMFKQYFKIKRQVKDAVLFFRMGDFYEMFGDDAVEASGILNITLTARRRGTPYEIPMCGVPHHSHERYLKRLVKAGRKVAICDQVGEAGKGLVERQVIRIITPGTTFDLEHKENNYLMAIVPDEAGYGISFVDVTTGEFKYCLAENQKELKIVLEKIQPQEVIAESEELGFLDKRFDLFVVSHQVPPFFEPERILKEHFKTKTFKGFGLGPAHNLEIKASALLLSYLQETQKSALSHLLCLSQYNFQDYMILDNSTIRNLEIFKNNQDGGYERSLLSIIDSTKTAMGARLLRQWLAHPLLQEEALKKRFEQVHFFFQEKLLRDKVRELLSHISDLERILGKIGCNRASPRDLVGLKLGLSRAEKIAAILLDCCNSVGTGLDLSLQNNQQVIHLIDQAILDEPAPTATEGGIIKDSYSQELDELRDITQNVKSWLVELQQKEIERTGIQSLKIKFNKIFGYFIEVTRPNLKLVPDDYIRKQTIATGERFVTQELKEQEEKILNAEERIKILENSIFVQVVQEITKYAQDIQKTACLISQIDVFANFAEIAYLNNYSKPEILQRATQIIEIKAGRHPVIEKIQEEQYIPNDLLLNKNENQIILLTGPNMSGKSSYLRQNALIVYLAQIGSFVPAEKVRLNLADRIFSRVGAVDNLAQGQSTFMVEMQEAANILHNATSRSLVIIDELGRGTSTYDGLSLAWSIIEYLHNQTGSRILFATHYHELIEVVEKLEKAQNFSIAVSEKQGQVLFLHQVQKHGTAKSYGIEVAKLAGIPESIIERAQSILQLLEDKRSREILGQGRLL